MKKILLLAIAAMFAQVAVAQNETKQQRQGKSKTLYVIDGKVASKEEFEKMQPEAIKNINVLKGIEEAFVVTTKAGEAAVKRGSEVVKIRAIKYDDPKNPGKKVVIGDTSALNLKGKVVVVYPDKETFDKYVERDMKSVIVDETADKSISIHFAGEKDPDKRVAATPLIIVKVKDGEVKVVKSMKDINPNDIQSVTVIKDSKAEVYKKYGDVSKGVIFIELK